MPGKLPAGLIPCSDCGTEHDYIPGTRRGQKCEPCFKVMVSGCVKAWREARRTAPRCSDCNEEMPLRIGKGTARERCTDCRGVRLRKRDSARYYESRRTFTESGVCTDCDSPFPRTGKGGPVPKRCDSCKHVWQRDLDRANGSNRRARKLALPYETIRPSEVYTRDGWICQLCTTVIDPGLKWPDTGSRSIDHVQPLSRGGHHVWANVQAAHLGCNLRKSCNYELMEAA